MTEVQRICLAALDRPAEERAAFLADACHGDEALRHEIESLLAHASAAEHFIEHPAVARAGALAGLSGLSLGQRLGPFTIVAKLGVGGMGEVYRAHDTQLGREVAIKILPVVFATDPDRLARFEREARILASLNHPHIAAIYGVEAEPADDGVPRRALVMELVEGPTLAERILRGPLPIAEVLPVARQIAEALEAAHEQGIIHRDLKPANVKVRPDGTVKVLDFGLAKEMEPAGATVDVALSPSLTVPAMTEAGVILGTTAYMSPEQVQGRNVGRRSDVWAFGCVMFEMLTGRQAFPSGETVADTLAGVLTREPDWDALPATTPATVRSLIHRCLRKDARRRLPDIAQARIELEEAAGEPTPASQGTSVPASRHEWLWPVVAVVSLIAAAAFAAWIILLPKPDARVYRFQVNPPSGVVFSSQGEPISPDGRMLAVVGLEGGRKQLWVYSLDSATFRRLPGTEIVGAEIPLRPAWSPDSRYLAFIAAGQLKKVSVDSGPSPVMVIGDAQGRRDVAWGAGVILLGGGGGPLLRVPEGGGQAVPATKLGSDEITHDYPAFFPDGRRFLYLVRPRRPDGSPVPQDGYEMYVGSLDSAEQSKLPGIHYGARISPTGHIIFQRDGTLMAQPMDLDTLKFTGEPFPLAEGTYTGPHAAFSMSTNGSLAYEGSFTISESQLVWFDQKGKQLPEVVPAGVYRGLDLSIDGKFAAFVRPSDAGGDVFRLDLERGSSSERLTTDGFVAMPVWSPDNQSIAYLSSREPAGGTSAPGNSQFGDLYARGVGDAGPETVVRKDKDGKTPTDWSKSGYLAYISRGDVWALLDPLSGHSEPIPVTNNTPSLESEAKISPDGRWIAYQSESASEGRQVFVQSFPKPGRRWVVSSSRGGAIPRWSDDGSKLFYLEPNRVGEPLTMMSVAIKESVEEGLTLGKPTPLFPTPLRNSQGRDYAVDAKGRFLFNVPTVESPPPHLKVIVNWEIPPARRAGS